MSKFDTISFQEEAEILLKGMEADQAIYDIFLKDRTRRKEDLQVVHMRAFFDLIAFNHLKKLVPDYIPGEFVGKKIGQELTTVADYVSIVNNEVVISPQYEEFLALKASYKKPQDDGTISKM